MSIIEQGALLAEVKHRRLAVSQPILSTDQEQQLNQILQEVVFYQEQVNLTLYQSGFLTHISGVIYQVDPILKQLNVRTHEKEEVVCLKDLVKIERV